MRIITTALAMIGMVAAPAFAAPKGVRPGRIGLCTATTVAFVGTRLEDGAGHPVPDSGASVRLANGVYGVSYDHVPAVQHARRGDRALTCLVRLPSHCPPGDDRGRWYTTTDLRTMESWTLPDAEHMCGGA